MDIGWYLVLSAAIFCIGLLGVLTRRSPLVILICLELMLNAGNLALIAFSRMTGTADGQVFALIVMIVAACEVVIGLGLIDTTGVELEAGFGSPAAIGELLLGKFLVAFEAASYLLLVTAVGAIVLARRRRGLEDAGGDVEPTGAG